VEYLVVSDSHGRVDRVVKYARGKDFAGIIHAGDYYRDGLYLGEELKIPAYAVHGNCDGVWDGVFEEVLQLEGVNIFLTHGHFYHVKHDLQIITQKAREQNADLVIFGHSHVPVNTKINGIWLLNPGSPSRPREGTAGSIGVLKITKDGFTAEIISL